MRLLIQSFLRLSCATLSISYCFFFFFNDTATTEIYTLSLHDALPIYQKPDAIREALATFTGVDRRFQIRGVERGVTVVDDYGHHPTEIQATLESARLGGDRRILVVF